MYCPRCRIEYTEGHTECEECGVELVKEMPPEPEGEYVDWVTVLTTRDNNVVMVAASLLEDADIPVFIKDEGLSSVLPVLVPVKLQVMPEHLAKARLLLEQEGGIELDAE